MQVRERERIAGRAIGIVVEPLALIGSYPLMQVGELSPGIGTGRINRSAHGYTLSRAAGPTILE